ncbi:MAG TPA: 3-hydroxyacyl-CoA dehydrogenase NAD-binding domain-containing protein [Longimicrobiales bacterium]|nr:3-hydroxyacyl-CoA dehydrogenase NAD-binding domain-containing protein [Longimicrobiales bacterium]
MTSPLLTVDRDGLAWITFADPDRRLNVLDEGVLSRLEAHLEDLESRVAGGEVRAVVVISGKPDSFVAGADIEAIGRLDGPADAEAKSREGQAVFQRLRDLPAPSVAAIHGICLGGGTELALACRHRVASDHPKTRIGLPEVQLGLLPGWGGTTRLPRLIGLRAALDMLLTGKQLRASSAKRAGLVDAVLPPEGFRESVRRFTLGVLDGSGPSRAAPGLVDRFLGGTGLGRRIALSSARKKVMSQTGGHYPAPLEILDVLPGVLSRPVDQALQIEARAFGALAATAVHQHLLHVFHLREDARKTERAFPGIETGTVARMGVLGAGVMGGGIAQLAADNDIHVRMKDIREDAVAGGLEHARGLFDRQVQRRRMTPRQAEEAMGRVTGTLEYDGFGGLDLVVEAVVERLDVKRAVLAETEERIRGDCILATNTSSLPIDDISGALARPGRFCGMHFFNPVHRMPLVEVIRGEATDPETVATVHALAVRMGKVPVVCRDGPGFLVNRILGPYLNEAGYLLVEGVPMEELDGAAKTFGMPMGPARLLDEVGIDVAAHAGATLREAFGERMEPAPVLERMLAADRLGRKNGRGFYRYEKGKEAGVDGTVYADLGLPAPTPGAAQEEDVRRRLVLAMINEAARVLGDGIVATAADVDLGMIMGTGFPPFRGGLLRFADDQHPRAILERMQALRAQIGPRFEPAPVLIDLAADNRTFYEAFGGT